MPFTQNLCVRLMPHLVVVGHISRYSGCIFSSQLLPTCIGKEFQNYSWHKYNRQLFLRPTCYIVPNIISLHDKTEVPNFRKGGGGG